MGTRPKGFRRKLGRLIDTFGAVASGEVIQPVGDVRFVIFAHARSGSTSFMRAMERHPRIRVLNEPFSETFTEHHPHHPDYRREVVDTETLDRYVPDMYSECNGIKVLSYQRPRELYQHLLRSSDVRVIVMRRANILQAVVSMMVSEQTDVWHAWDVDVPLEQIYARLAPLEVNEVRARMDVLADEVRYYDQVLSAREPAEVLRITYEDLYLRGGARSRRLLGDATRFVGLDPVLDEQADALLDPERTKLNSQETYRFVPNADEIDAALGSDLRGRLFGREAASA